MRWLPRWPFRGGAEPLAPATASPDETEGAAVSDQEGPGRAEAAWAGLPPLVATVVAAPLTAPSREFAAGLAGSHAPEPILQPLGHDVSADGPGGLVAGLATPILDTHPRTRAGEGLPRPPRPAGRGRHASAARATDGGPVDPSTLASESPSAAAPALARPPAAPGRGPLAPVSHDARETRRLLTAVRPETLALVLDPMASTAAPSSAATDRDADATGRVAATRAVPSPAPASTGPAAGEAGPRLGPAAGRTRSPGTVTVRRSGLGAPLAGPPPIGATAAGARPGRVPPPHATRPAPTDRPALPPAARAVVSGGRALPPATLGGPAILREGETEPAPPMTSPMTSPARSLVTGPGAPSGTRDRETAAGGGRTVTTRAAGSARPLVGAGSLLAVPNPAGGQGHPAGGGGTAPAAPRVQRSTTGSRSGAGGAAEGLGAATTGPTARERGPEPLPAVAPAPIPSPSGLRPASGAGAPALPSGGGPAERRAARPPGWTGASAPPGASALPGAAAARTGLAIQRLGVPAAIAPARAASPGPQPLALTSPIAATSPAGPAVQRAVEVEEVSADVTGGAGASAGGGAREAGAGAGLAAATDGDLDLLARRLYGRIRDRLRGELLLDRERSGSLADF